MSIEQVTPDHFRIGPRRSAGLRRRIASRRRSGWMFEPKAERRGACQMTRFKLDAFYPWLRHQGKQCSKPLRQRGVDVAIDTLDAVTGGGRDVGSWGFDIPVIRQSSRA